jgi:hypothetical protein
MVSFKSFCGTEWLVSSSSSRRRWYLWRGVTTLSPVGAGTPVGMLPFFHSNFTFRETEKCRQEILIKYATSG